MISLLDLTKYLSKSFYFHICMCLAKSRLDFYISENSGIFQW